MLSAAYALTAMTLLIVVVIAVAEPPERSS